MYFLYIQYCLLYCLVLYCTACVENKLHHKIVLARRLCAPSPAAPGGATSSLLLFISYATGMRCVAVSCGMRQKRRCMPHNAVPYFNATQCPHRVRCDRTLPLDSIRLTNVTKVNLDRLASSTEASINSTYFRHIINIQELIRR